MPSSRPKMLFQVRPAGRDDIARVDALLGRSYPRLLRAAYPASVLVTAVPLISKAQPALVTCGTYYVAETRDRRIIGAGGWTRRDPATGSEGDGLTGNIRHFATDPDAVRKGIGGAIMRHCLSEAARAGMTAMRCHATRNAVPFYVAHGFTPHAEIELELRPGIRFRAVQMARDLTPSVST